MLSYNELKAKLVETTDIREYLRLLNELKKYDVAILLAVRDTPGNCMPDDVFEAIHALGFRSFSKELWRMYIGVNVADRDITDLLSDKAEEKLSLQTDINGTKVEIRSEAWRNGNVAEIKINGQDYARNLRGINIVVFSKDEQQVIDSIGYDSHEEKANFERNPWLGLTGKHYDICLVGVWYGANYGSTINGYAEYKILQNFGKSVLMMQKPGAAKGDVELKPSNHNVKFILKHYSPEDIAPLVRINELEKLNEYVDGFCVGSDQIWNYPVSVHGIMYLPFAHDDKYRISYSTSCGSSNDHVPADKVSEVKEQLQKFNAISVRESSSSKVLKEKYGVSSEVLIDPVFTLDLQEYEKIIEESQFDTTGSPYLLAYILDPTDEKIDFLLKSSELLNLHLIIVADGFYGILKCSWEKYDKGKINGNFIKGALVEDFLKLVHDASLVITDSFHGTAFSIIFERQFISICNSKRGKNRFYDLLEKLDLTDRLIDGKLGNVNIEKLAKSKIPYERVNEIISRENEQSRRWLEYALNPSKLKDKNILKANVQYCTGCAACANICPTDAIDMKPNYDGFYNPSVDYDKGVNCGKCTDVCPALKISGGGTEKQ